MTTASIVSIVAGLLGMVYGLYFAFIGFVGWIKKTPRIPKMLAKKRLAVLIPARNEEGVIPYAISSLQKQRYPKELYEIIVVPNNCTDGTAAVAKKMGVRVLDAGKEIHSKGEALKEIFAMLAPEKFDGYVVLDADNVVDEGFLQAMNEALCAGYDVGQGRRESKNPNDSWVANCTCTFFRFMNSLSNRSRAALGMSAALNGTGVLYSSRVIRELGYDMTTLTEDLEFTALCALHDIKIAYVGNAITFDEQPVSLVTSFIQRRRWGAGSVQGLRKFGWQLFKKGTLQSFDCLLVFLGQLAAALSVVPGIISFAQVLQRYLTGQMSLTMALLFLAGSIFGMFITGVLYVLIVNIASGTMSKKLFPQSLMMGFFLLTWIPANLINVFTKPPKWKEIPHVSKTSVDQAQNAYLGENR